MGRLLLIWRLALRDLRHRPVEAVLVVLAITAATATLTLGLVLRSFAVALGLRVGERVTLDGHSYRVTVTAVTAASPPYPETGFMATPAGVGDSPGQVWLTRADTISLATRARPLTYTVDVRTQDPAALAGPAGFNGPWTSWQAISAQDAKEISNEQLVLDVGGWLLGLLAIASVGVLVGGRLAEQTRRVGLLKAAGAAPGLVAAIMLAEYLALALCAAVIGVAVGRLTAPMLTSFSFFAGLLAKPAQPPLTPQTVGVVAGVAVAVAVVSTLVPALRAARTPTVRALADAARQPKRHALATTAWATVLDGRYPAALARALGTTPRQLTAGLSASQLLPALPGGIIGVPAGIGLYAAVSNGGGLTLPPFAWLVAVVLAVLLAVALLTAIPARIGAGHPIVGILQSEAA